MGCCICCPGSDPYSDPRHLHQEEAGPPPIKLIFLGPSGAGKTTIFQQITNTYNPESYDKTQQTRDARILAVNVQEYGYLMANILSDSEHSTQFDKITQQAIDYLATNLNTQKSKGTHAT